MTTSTFTGVPIKPQGMVNWHPLGTIWHPFEGAGTYQGHQRHPNWFLKNRVPKGSPMEDPFTLDWWNKTIVVIHLIYWVFLKETRCWLCCFFLCPIITFPTFPPPPSKSGTALRGTGGHRCLCLQSASFDIQARAGTSLQEKKNNTCVDALSGFRWL